MRWPQRLMRCVSRRQEEGAVCEVAPAVPRVLYRHSPHRRQHRKACMHIVPCCRHALRAQPAAVIHRSTPCTVCCGGTVRWWLGSSSMLHHVSAATVSSPTHPPRHTASMLSRPRYLPPRLRPCTHTEPTRTRKPPCPMGPTTRGRMVRHRQAVPCRTRPYQMRACTRHRTQTPPAVVRASLRRPVLEAMYLSMCSWLSRAVMCRRASCSALVAGPPLLHLWRCRWTQYSMQCANRCIHVHAAWDCIS